MQGSSSWEQTFPQLDNKFSTFYATSKTRHAMEKNLSFKLRYETRRFNATFTDKAIKPQYKTATWGPHHSWRFFQIYCNKILSSTAGSSRCLYPEFRAKVLHTFFVPCMRATCPFRFHYSNPNTQSAENNDRITLICNLRKADASVWTGYIRLRTESCCPFL